MGWCSGTEIMDTALRAADHLAAAVWAIGYNAGAAGDEADFDEVLKNRQTRARLDDVLRPYVRQIARKLHEGDWDCVDEADEFDRFPQEMYDHDDTEHESWLRARMADAETSEEALAWSYRLKAHTDKMKAGNA
jgi:hypothetical protein